MRTNRVYKVMNRPLKLNFDQDYISPSGDISVVFQLAGKESSILEIQYGPDATEATTTVVPSPNLTVVDAPDDLDANWAWIAFFYHPAKTLVSVMALVVASVLVLPRKSFATFKILNQALKSGAPDDDELWDLVFSRIRYLLIDNFRDFCITFGKPAVPASAEELFAFVRDRLRVDFALTARQFESGTQLNSALRVYMRELALNS